MDKVVTFSILFVVASNDYFSDYTYLYSKLVFFLYNRYYKYLLNPLQYFTLLVANL